MKYVKLVFSKMKIIAYIMVISFFLTILNLIFPINNTINSLISLILILLYTFIDGICFGKQVNRKAYWEGLKKGLVTLGILYLVSLLFFSFGINLKRLIYMVAILFSTILGSIIGINKKGN